MSSKTKRTVAAIATLVVLLLLAIGAWFMFRTPGPSSRDAASAGAPVRIRVGVVFSRHTAQADNSGNGPVGYERMARISREMMTPQIELLPIVDPGSARDPDVVEACHTFFGAAPPIDGGDAQALGALDVIVASHTTHLQPQMMDAIEDAVRDSGTGFLMRMFFCQYEPGFTPQVRGLLGFAPDGPIRYVSSPGVECDVVGEHPLLGNLSGTGKKFKMAPNGFAGPVNGMTLLRIANRADDPNAPQGVELGALLYVSSLGKGTIVGCPFAGAKPVPRELEQSGPGSFSTRAVNWLAEQKRAASTRPSSVSRPSN